MKTIRPELIRQRKRRIRQRLEHSARHDRGRPMLAGANLRYELAEKAGGTAYGGLAAIHTYAVKIGLLHRIDNALHLFKKHLPCHAVQGSSVTLPRNLGSNFKFSKNICGKVRFSLLPF